MSGEEFTLINTYLSNSIKGPKCRGLRLKMLDNLQRGKINLKKHKAQAETEKALRKFESEMKLADKYKFQPGLIKEEKKADLPYKNIEYYDKILSQIERRIKSF